MLEQGFRGDDPLMRLIQLKWYLRAVTNAIMDSAIHVDGMTREQAMQLMTETGFQEEREAAGKWVRAQLTFDPALDLFRRLPGALRPAGRGRAPPRRQIRPQGVSRPGAVVRLATGALRARTGVRRADSLTPGGRWAGTSRASRTAIGSSPGSRRDMRAGRLPTSARDHVVPTAHRSDQNRSADRLKGRLREV